MLGGLDAGDDDAGSAAAVCAGDCVGGGCGVAVAVDAWCYAYVLVRTQLAGREAGLECFFAREGGVMECFGWWS